MIVIDPMDLLPWMALAFVFDIFAILLWFPPYFRFGVPVLYRQRILSDVFDLSFCRQVLEPKAYMGRDIENICFQSIGKYECAFATQPKLIGGRRIRGYPPFMHGLIRVNPETKKLTVIVFLNWSALLGIIIFASLHWIFALTVAIFFFIDWIRYFDVSQDTFDYFSEAAEGKARLPKRKIKKR